MRRTKIKANDQDYTDSKGVDRIVHSTTLAGEVNLATAFLANARQHLTNSSFIRDHRDVAYGELTEMVEVCCLHLINQRGWRTRTRVAIRLPNSPEYAAAFYGILLAGGIAVPLPMEQSARWVESVIEMTRCQWIFEVADSESAQSALRSLKPQLHDAPETEVPADLAAIFFTSGSSGSPKGVMLSHQNLLSNSQSICLSLPVQDSDRALAVLPFCHAYGNSVLQSHLLTGSTLVVAGSPTFPATLIEAMSRHKVTSFAGVPDLYRLLLPGLRSSPSACSDLRYATVAGGALRPEVIDECAELLAPADFYVMYGQTEATARLSCLDAKECKQHHGSIGRGIPGVAIEVVNEHGTPVAAGQVGQIRARGDNVMLGYWNDPVATAEILREGWLYTGDLATVDDDGFVYPKGRTSQLLKIGGYRLHPAEIETVIAGAFPTLEPIVVPFETDDHFTRLALFLLPRREGFRPDLEKIRASCRRLLARHQRPDLIAFQESAPLTASLKIDRLELSRQAAEIVHRRVSQ